MTPNDIRPWPLTTDELLENLEELYPDSEVVSLLNSGNVEAAKAHATIRSFIGELRQWKADSENQP